MCDLLIVCGVPLVLFLVVMAILMEGGSGSQRVQDMIDRRDSNV